MKLYDVSPSQQIDIVDSNQEEDIVVFDQSDFNKYDNFKV